MTITENTTQEKLTKNSVETTTDKTYDAMNRLTEEKRNNVTVAKYAYTDTGAKASIQYGSASAARKIGYSYDEAGKVNTGS